MKRALLVLAHALICTALLSVPTKGFAEDAPQARTIASAPIQVDDSDSNLMADIDDIPEYPTTDDMNRALASLPDAK